jgi:hypothetical protein
MTVTGCDKGRAGEAIGDAPAARDAFCDRGCATASGRSARSTYLRETGNKL